MKPLRAVGRAVGDAVLEGVGRAASRVQETRARATDLLEGEDAYLVVMDAPGATASDVQVRYRNGTVLVRVDRFRDYHEGFEMKFPGRGLSLDGRVRLPDDALVDPDLASAILRENGTLEIRIPKREGTPIEIGDDGGRAGSDGHDESNTDSGLNRDETT